MYDTIIIGSGPAGMTAGIYAARREMKTIIIGKESGGQIALASEIENYPGFKKINNYDLIDKITEQVKNLGVAIKNNEVKSIKKQKDGSFILYDGKNEYAAKTIIIAMGLKPRRLAILGEKELIGHGVSYCANCDGPLYRNKIVAVVGGGNSALDATEVLSKIAAKVYLIHRRDEFKGFETLVDEIKARKNIIMMLNSELKEIIGPGKVAKVKILNNTNNKEIEIKIDGVFIEIGRIAHTDLINGLVKRDEWGQIIIDDLGRTSDEGIFAAGDVTQTKFKQITIACGQGTIAALAAYQYLQLKQGKKANIYDRSVKK